MSDIDGGQGETPTPRVPRRRIVIQLAIGVAVLAIVAVLVAVVVTNDHAAKTATATPSHSIRAPKNMLSDGVLIVGGNGVLRTVRTPAIPAGTKPVATDESTLTKTANIVEYIDYQCPYCLAFEQANLGNVAKWVGNGTATLELHPVAILDRSSEGTRYSSRAANAAACVANFAPDRYIFVAAALYQNQPNEGTVGLSNSTLISVLSGAGASGSAITSCIGNETFRSWVTAATLRAVDGSFTGVATTPSRFEGTPTVFVNGAIYTGSITDAATFTAFVEKQVPGSTK